MKANELMLGDWVQNPLGYKAQVLDIHYIKDEGDGFGGGYRIHIGKSNWGSVQWLEEKDIEPIRLTPEILEKNGFIFDKNRKAYLMGLIFQLHQRFDGSFYLNGVQCLSISAVHELQHALRLCGIEKEIIVKED